MTVKEIFHATNGNSIIIYLPSCNSKYVCGYFFNRIHKFDRDGHHELSFFGKELCEDDLLLFSNKFGVT